MEDWGGVGWTEEGGRGRRPFDVCGPSTWSRHETFLLGGPLCVCVPIVLPLAGPAPTIAPIALFLFSSQFFLSIFFSFPLPPPPPPPPERNQKHFSHFYLLIWLVLMLVIEATLNRFKSIIDFIIELLFESINLIFLLVALFQTNSLVVY